MCGVMRQSCCRNPKGRANIEWADVGNETTRSTAKEIAYFGLLHFFVNMNTYKTTSFLLVPNEFT